MSPCSRSLVQIITLLIFLPVTCSASSNESFDWLDNEYSCGDEYDWQIGKFRKAEKLWEIHLTVEGHVANEAEELGIKVKNPLGLYDYTQPFGLWLDTYVNAITKSDKNFSTLEYLDGVRKLYSDLYDSCKDENEDMDEVWEYCSSIRESEILRLHGQNFIRLNCDSTVKNTVDPIIVRTRCALFFFNDWKNRHTLEFLDTISAAKPQEDFKKLFRKYISSMGKLIEIARTCETDN